jgi:hypothetical protein
MHFEQSIYAAILHNLGSTAVGLKELWRYNMLPLQQLHFRGLIHCHYAAM